MRKAPVVLATLFVLVLAALLVVSMQSGIGRAVPPDDLLKLPEGKTEGYAVSMNGSRLAIARNDEFSVADSQVVVAGQPLQFEGWIDLSREYYDSLPRLDGRDEIRSLLILGIHAQIDGNSEVTALPIQLNHTFDSESLRMGFEGSGTAPTVPGVYHCSVALFGEFTQPATVLFQSFLRVNDVTRD